MCKGLLHLLQGFCGVVIFSLWDDGNNVVTEKEKGDAVTVYSFKGEGSGKKSIKQLDWRPDEEITFEVRGKYNARMKIWNIQCNITIYNEMHHIATFQRTGENKIQDDFKFSSFVEDYKRNENSVGCLYERSAHFISPEISYKEKGVRKTIKLDKAIFMKDQNPGQGFCSDWSCANSGKKIFSIRTGGSRLGKPNLTCEHNTVLFLRNTNGNAVQRSKNSTSLKTCKEKT